MRKWTYVILTVLLAAFSFQGELLAGESDITIQQIKGLVQVQRAGEADWVKAQEPSTVTSGDKVRSFLESSAVLVFPDGSEFQLRENTSVDVKDISQNAFDKTAKRELKLNLGSLHYKVPPQKERATEFKVHSSTSIVGITGTEGVITAKGEGKPSENILIEGATYNTDEQGLDGRLQRSGNVYRNDGQAAQLFSADVEEESAMRMAIDTAYIDMIKGVVTAFKAKRDEGYRVGEAEKFIKQAFFYLEKREYDLVQQTVEHAGAVLTRAKKLKLPDDLDEKIAGMLTALDEKETEGYDVAKPYALLAKAQGLKQSGDFGDIRQVLTQAEKELAQITEGGLTQDNEGSFMARYQDVQKRVLEKGQQGFAIGENKALLRQAGLFYAQGEKPRAYLFLKEADDKLALALKTVSDAFTAKIANLEEEVATKRASSYPTKELELRLEKVKVYIKEENFIRARESVATIEEGLVTLKKSISAEWQLKIADLKKNINYKRSTGYDLDEIPGLVGEIEDYQAQGDLVNLEKVYDQAVEELSKLKLPKAFEASWNNFLKQRGLKADQGYDLKAVDDLSAQVQAAMDAGDIKSARTFLSQAKKTLTELKDQEPPKVQVISFTEDGEKVSIEGFASDNIKVKNVLINQHAVELTKEGRFSFRTIANPTLKQLSILATDIENNISAPVVLNLTSTGTPIDDQAGLKDVKVDYTQDKLVVEGKFVSGGRVKVGRVETVCDDSSWFKVTVKPEKNTPSDTIVVAGILSDDTTTEETVLAVEDKWAPKIKITKVSFDNNFLPALNVDPLSYDGNKLSVNGQVVLTQMANIEGTVFDLGGEIESLKVEDTDVDIREDGVFNASLTIDRSRKDPTVQLVAVDKSGNTVEEQVALDATWNWPFLKINDRKTFQRVLGKFSKEIQLTADMTDITLILENSDGETIISKRLPVAAVLPPELEIQEIRYEGEKIVISGRSNADGTVSDKNKAIFPEDVEVTKNEIFTLTADYPPVDQEVILVASNIEGKLSEEVTVVAGPPKDTKAPVVYLSAPVREGGDVAVKGFVEDDSEVARVTVHGTPVEVTEQGAFRHLVPGAADLDAIEIAASDAFGNKVQRTIALNDKEKPQITINTWEARDGRLIIAGKASDNVGIRQVRLNDMPIAVGESKELAFSYNGALTEGSKDAVIVAVDLLNNEVREGPRAITIPTDETAPKGKGIGMKYGSPIVYASGAVIDPAGVKAVYVNGEQVELFDDGTFNIKVGIDVGLPKLELESPAYDVGKVAVAGKVAAGDFTPAKITVESEDLSGNRGVLFSQAVEPYQLNELEVSVNGHVVDVGDDGSFQFEQPIVLGQRSVEVTVQDPFDNSLFETQALEDKKPVLTLNPLEYNADDETVVLTGQAQDEGSGLYIVSVNGIRTDVSGDGSFRYKTTFNQASMNVLATDYVGNETSLTKEVKPPDIWAPVFALSVTPIPAIVGDPVYVEIAALDSKTHLPELLSGTPVVKANADGVPVLLTVEGEGSNYIATLDTTGLEAALVTLEVEGSDEAGNASAETEGASAFALVADDAIAPSFTVETTPSPVQLGVPATVKVLSSEDLKTVPTLTAVLPSGTAKDLVLTQAGSGTYQASLSIPVEEGIGAAILKLSGGEDLSGNAHEATEVPVDITAPVVITELPLNINVIDFVAERFVLSGQTAAEAIVRVEAGQYAQDIVADAQGIFRFERPVTMTQLEEMYTRGPSIAVKLKAHNYAGFESRQRFFDVPLPPLPEKGGANFEMRVFPSPVGQGEMINFNVEPRKRSTLPPKGFLYLPGGRRVPVELRGQTTFTGQYMIPDDTVLGTAMFEVVSGDFRESIPVDIVLSDKWMQRLNKNEFFRIRVSEDPLIIGEQGQFFIETMGDLPTAPRLEIRLPNGRRDPIPLSGSNRFFQGSYICPADVTPGSAELILNPGMPGEVRRPYGVEDKFAMGDMLDAFLSVNPNPLVGGKSYDVNLSFSQTVTFKPKLVLKLQSGRVIDIPLSGAVPGNRFSARQTLASDVMPGLAKFVLSDDRGMALDSFPTQVSAPLATTTGADIFVVPDVLRRMENGTVQLNTLTVLYGRVEAQVSFPDGTRKVIPLDGSGTQRKGTFMVPDYVPLGLVTISVYHEGRALGTVNARVEERGGMTGPLHIFLDNPDFRPFDRVKLNVEANWPLAVIPKAELFWQAGSMKVTLTGQVPGNRFVGEFTAPKDPIDMGRIEIRDGQSGALLGDFPLDHGPEGEGEIIVTPMPPIMGQPLSIKVVAPTVLNTAPILRLIFDDGQRKDLNAYGPLPGDTFTASLAMLDKPLRMIEVIHNGVVVESIPVEFLSMTNFEFYVDVIDPYIAPCDITDVIVRSNNYVPFIPGMSVDFNGRIMDIPLSKMSPTEFLGRMSVPCNVSFASYNMRIFDPQGKLLWQRNFASDMTTSTGMLMLNVMPVDAISVELTWDMITGVDGFEIRYGETPALGKTVFAGNTSYYRLSNLITGKTYFFQVAARKSYQDVMTSEIRDVVVGGTTRELIVNFNVMDNDVNLYWTDYIGADKYRVLWGTAIGNYPNKMETSALNYFIPDLTFGGNYYVKVQALKLGAVIGESRDIYLHVEEFMATGGEIFFNPDPPMVGQYLGINMHFFQDLPFVPRVVIRLQDRDVTLTPTGQYRDYQTYLTASAFNVPIMVVDVLDPQGRIIASRTPVGGTYAGTSVTIDVMPDPPMTGSSLQVKANFSEKPSFVPKLVVEFASGYREYPSGQAAYQYTYDWYIPVADMYSSVLSMKVVNPTNGNMVGERHFTVGDAYADSPFEVMPDPPMVGQSVNMELDTGMMVSMAPKLRIYFASGSMQEVTMNGTLPGMHFTYSIGYLNSLIDKIDIIDPSTNIVKHTWMPGQFGPTSCTLNLSSYPPRLDEALRVRADFPGALPYTPEINLYMTGNMRWYMFPQGPGQSSYEIFIPKEDLTTVNRIEVWNDMNDLLLCEEVFAATSLNVENLTIMPYPPVSGQSFQIHVEFNTPPMFAPRWRLDTTTGSYSGNFSQGAGYSVYDQSVPAGYFSGIPVELEIQDDYGMYISGGEAMFDVDMDFTCTATFAPDPPVPYSSLIVTATYPAGSEPTYKPWVFIDFDGGGYWSREFTQAAGMQAYSMSIDYTYMTDDVVRIGIGDSSGSTMDCGKDFAVQAVNAILTINPDPPDLGQSLYVTATFGSNAPFIPELVIEYTDSTRDYFMFSGAAGQLTYQLTVPKEEFNTTIDRLILEDDYGHEITDLVVDSVGTFNITNLSTPAYDEINVCWTYMDWIDEYKIYFKTPTGSYYDGDSPVTVGNQSCYTLGINETLMTNTTYYLKVEAYDAGTFMYATPEDSIALSATSVEYPRNLWLETTGVSGEMKVHWDSVTGVDGYRVYYGTSSDNYNESGSPLDVTDSSATQAVITSLNNTTRYYVTVEAYIGGVESNNPNEVNGYPGTGGGTLSASPASLAFTGSAGTLTATQSVSITNNGAAATIGVEAFDLSNGSYTIPASRYTFTPLSQAIPASSSATFTAKIQVPGMASDGYYTGGIRFFVDLDSDGYLDGGESYKYVDVSLNVSSTADHFRITPDKYSSTMGSPIFVTVRAEDSANNLVLSYDTDVTIDVSESLDGNLPGSWILSTNGEPGGPSSSTVAMFNGVGNFTVDAQEPETITIDLTGATGSPLHLEFGPDPSVSTATKFALVAPTRVWTDGGGANVWVAAVDNSGKVDTNYTGVANYTKSGSAVLSETSHAFVLSDEGQAQLTVTDSTAESVTLTVTGSLATASTNIWFVGVTVYSVNGQEGNQTVHSGAGETSIDFVLHATDGAGHIVRSYNKTATLVNETSTYLSEDPFDFRDGAAHVTMHSGGAASEVVRFAQTDNLSVGSGDITVHFDSADGDAPVVVRAEMDTPWIVHLYFDEDLDPSTAGEESNYTGITGATVNKVCWYGDNVTLHLSAKPTVSPFTVTINNVKDQATPTKNTVPTDYTTPDIIVPDVDYTGGPANSGNGDQDWFEVQVSDSSPDRGQTVHVTVYHKNVCGYLTGSNQTNANTTLGTVGIQYGGSLGQGGLSSRPSSVDMSSGQGEFDVTAGSATGTVTIKLDPGVLETQIYPTLTIP